jgi:hypothetical protein
MKNDDRILCPSSTCSEGAILLGIVMPSRTVGYADELLTIDADFVQTARDAGEPEARFRFAGRCVRSACKQWSDGRCSVIDKVLDASRLRDLPEIMVYSGWSVRLHGLPLRYYGRS